MTLPVALIPSLGLLVVGAGLGMLLGYFLGRESGALDLAHTTLRELDRPLAVATERRWARLNRACAPPR